MSKTGVKLDLNPLLTFSQRLANVAGSFRAMTLRWAARYRGFARARFVRFAQGGGDWPRLAPSTLAARRRRTAKGRLFVTDKKTGKRRKRKFRTGASSLLSQAPRILWDKGLLLGALRPQFVVGRGQLQEQLRNGIRVGYGGPTKHPNGDGATIADIAHFHQTGEGTVPVREIIVEPDMVTTQGMVRDLEWAVEREGR